MVHHSRKKREQCLICEEWQISIYTRVVVFIMWLFFFLSFLSVIAHEECCEDSYECVPPDIVFVLDDRGVTVRCPVGVVCGWVSSELSTCTCGDTWQLSGWTPFEDPRMRECFQATFGHSLKLDGILRWWSRDCMGHETVSFVVDVEPSFLDVFMHYSSIVHMEEVHRHYNYTAIARSGAEGNAVAQSLKSTMYYEVTMDEYVKGVHMEIDSCSLEILSSGASDSEVLTTYYPGGTFNYNITYADPNGERVSYRAIMDEEYYSPWQRIMCSYTMKNGTTTMDTFQHGHSYMIYDPFDSGQRYT